MSVQNIIKVVQELVDEHQALVAIVDKKTAVIKANDMDGLSDLLMKERKQIQAITQLENKRMDAVDEFARSKQMENETKSISDLFEWIEDKEEKVQLEQYITALVEEIVKLRQMEELNKELIEQSMAFIQVSLDMLTPSIHSMNYHEADMKKPIHRTSVFDSKA